MVMSEKKSMIVFSGRHVLFQTSLLILRHMHVVGFQKGCDEIYCIHSECQVT